MVFAIGRDITEARETQEKLQQNEERFRAAINVTDRTKTAEALRLSEDRFSIVFHSSPCMMVIISIPDYRYVDVNQCWLDTTTFDYKEVIGRTVEEIGYWPEPQFQQMMLLLEENGRIQNLEIKFRTSQGRVRYGLWSGEIITIKDERCLLGATIDITERKKLEKEMARLDRLYLIGEMAAGIAHEIRNPMTVVRGYLQLLQNKEGTQLYQKQFNLMIQELDRANAIITEYLSLAKNKAACMKEQNLNNILFSMLPLIQSEANKASKAIRVETGCIPDLLLDDKEIAQVILNLTKNGLEAMANEGVLILKTYQDGEAVVLSVQDQGTGIPPGILDRIGTPFFTTKDGGTGLGLAVCYSIASRHNAAIRIETGSAGTTFFVNFNTADRVQKYMEFKLTGK